MSEPVIYQHQAWAFFGTHLGWTEAQRQFVTEHWPRWLPCELWHGDIMGADYQMHHLALRYQAEVPCLISVIPPMGHKYRAHVLPQDDTVLLYPPLPAKTAIDEILRPSYYALITPYWPRPLGGSRTWEAILSVRAYGWPTVIVYGDGTVEYERIPAAQPEGAA